MVYIRCVYGTILPFVIYLTLLYVFFFIIKRNVIEICCTLYIHGGLQI